MNLKNYRELFDSIEFEKDYHYDGLLGSHCSAGGTVFRVWAPTAQQVKLCLYRTGHEVEMPRQFALSKQDRGVWEYRTDENLDGAYYTYDVTVDGTTRSVADPYARACGVNGKRSMVIDLDRTNPVGWDADTAPGKQPEDIIYEVHVKEFSWDKASGIAPEYRGKYLGLCQQGTTKNGDGVHPTGLDYLKHLGVTHVQLMPVYDYGSVDEAGSDLQSNWGYDPMNYNVPEGSYATDPYHGEVRIRELKQAIQALHSSGIRVIMDVVYNHTYHLDSCLQGMVPWYYYRQNQDGTASNGSGCGNETASERSMCAKYILDSVLYWAREYHIDGFRFDLMGLLPVELMNRIRTALDEEFGTGEKLVFGEPWCGGWSGVKPGTVMADKGNLRRLHAGVGAFCDTTRDAVKGNLFGHDARGIVNGGAFHAWTLERCIRGWACSDGDFSVKCPNQTISYLSCHDDWTLYDRLRNTISDDGDVLRANRLAAAILFGCQGHLFLLSGEEFARTKNGIKNTYNASPEINRLDWNRAWEKQSLADYYRGLIALRKQLPGLCDKTELAAARVDKPTEHCPGCLSVMVENGGKWEKLLLVYNAGEADVQIALPDGGWQILADGTDSFCWQNEHIVRGKLEIPRLSAVILGQKGSL